MTLFGTQKVNKGTVAEVAHMVENLFRSRNLDAHKQQVQESLGYGWWLREGSAKIFIFVQETQSGTCLRVTSPILKVPTANREQFYQKLLSINSDLSNCALALYQDVVLVVAQRQTQGLSQEELDSIVWNIAYVADLLDDRLAKEFGAVMYSGNN